MFGHLIRRFFLRIFYRICRTSLAVFVGNTLADIKALNFLGSLTTLETESPGRIAASGKVHGGRFQPFFRHKRATDNTLHRGKDHLCLFRLGAADLPCILRGFKQRLFGNRASVHVDQERTVPKVRWLSGILPDDLFGVHRANPQHTLFFNSSAIA